MSDKVSYLARVCICSPGIKTRRPEYSVYTYIYDEFNSTPAPRSPELICFFLCTYLAPVTPKL